MDPFGASYWNQLQTTLWFYKRSRVIVRLAADQRSAERDLSDGRDDPPGVNDDPDLIAEVVLPDGCIGKRSRSGPDCSFDAAEEQVLDALCRGRLAAFGRKNGEGPRERIPQYEWPALRLYWGRPLPELRHYMPKPLNDCRRYVGPRDQLQVNVPYWTDLLFLREEILALRPDPIRDFLRAGTERLTLAGAVALLIRERPASKEVWTRLRRRYGGRFPEAIQQRIEDAGQEFIGMMLNGEIAAKGRPCDLAEASEGKRQPIDADFLDEALWVEPCADGIWTEPALRDGRFNSIDRGYRDVLLKATQFLAPRAGVELMALDERDFAASVPAREQCGPAEDSLPPSSKVKRKGGRRAPWVKHLGKYLRRRCTDRDYDITSMSLRDIRVDFSGYATLYKIVIPRSRSSLETQIKKVRVCLP